MCSTLGKYAPYELIYDYMNKLYNHLAIKAILILKYVGLTLGNFVYRKIYL